MASLVVVPRFVLDEFAKQRCESCFGKTSAPFSSWDQSRFRAEKPLNQIVNTLKLLWCKFGIFDSSVDSILIPSVQAAEFDHHGKIDLWSRISERSEHFSEELWRNIPVRRLRLDPLPLDLYVLFSSTRSKLIQQIVPIRIVRQAADDRDS